MPKELSELAEVMLDKSSELVKLSRSPITPSNVLYKEALFNKVKMEYKVATFNYCAELGMTPEQIKEQIVE